MTIEQGRRMHADRGRAPEHPVTADTVKAAGLARGRALYRAEHDPDTGEATRARAVLADVAALAAAGGGS